MNKTVFFTATVLLLAQLSCTKQHDSFAENSASPTDKAAENQLSSSAAELKKDDPKNFVITANVRFKVDNVIKTTYNIESVTRKNGGMVVFTELKSEIHEINSAQISPDSSLETSTFTVGNVLTLRIPNNKLDTTLREISKNVAFIDYRIIKVEDVSLEMMGNTLAQKRNEKGAERVTNSESKKLNFDIENQGIFTQEAADNAKISNMLLNDKVKLSTVELSIYQNKQTTSKLIHSVPKSTGFGRSLGYEIVESLKFGWSIIESIFVFVLKLWSLILLFGVVFYILKRNDFFKKRKTVLV
jgi:Domain of unknown function (DUF4349)